MKKATIAEIMEFKAQLCYILAFALSGEFTNEELLSMIVSINGEML